MYITYCTERPLVVKGHGVSNPCPTHPKPTQNGVAGALCMLSGGPDKPVPQLRGASEKRFLLF